VSDTQCQKKLTQILRVGFPDLVLGANPTARHAPLVRLGQNVKSRPNGRHVLSALALHGFEPTDDHINAVFAHPQPPRCQSTPAAIRQAAAQSRQMFDAVTVPPSVASGSAPAAA
jgi:hypothetical protein